MPVRPDPVPIPHATDTSMFSVASMWAAKSQAVLSYLPAAFTTPGPLLQMILAFITTMLPTLLPLLTGCIPVASPAQLLSIMHVVAQPTLEGAMYRFSINREVLRQLRDGVEQSIVNAVWRPLCAGVAAEMGRTVESEAVLMLAA